jgi:hypothetical protein
MTPICTPANRELGLAIGLRPPPCARKACAHNDPGSAAAAILPKFRLETRMVSSHRIYHENAQLTFYCYKDLKLGRFPVETKEVVVIVRIKMKAPRLRWRHSWAAVTCLTLCASSTADMPPAQLMPAQLERGTAQSSISFAPDPRIERLERFFHSYHCPAPLHVPEYLQAADDYHLDYRLLPAISIRETRCGITDSDNNHWGFRNGQASFASVEEGIQFMSRRLAEHVYYKGKTLQQKLFTYNPLPAYPGEITRIMSQIE